MTLAPRSRPTTRSFERLYRAHVGDVYRYALGVTRNTADAEDVAQTTFMNAYRALERGAQPVTPRYWLIAIAHNVCRQHFRQRARRPVEVGFHDNVAEALVPSGDSPSATDIHLALRRLAVNQREALVMRELEGRSYAYIAEMLGISMSAVEQLLFRARRALREQLEGSLSCSEAEAALSQQLEGRLTRADAALLRSHLRACEPCRSLALRQRAQRKGIKALTALPLPQTLTTWFGFGGGASGVGAGLAAKAALVAAAAVVAGGGYAIVEHQTAGHNTASIPSRAAVVAARGRVTHATHRSSRAATKGSSRVTKSAATPEPIAAAVQTTPGAPATVPPLPVQTSSPPASEATAGSQPPVAQTTTDAAEPAPTVDGQPFENTFGPNPHAAELPDSASANADVCRQHGNPDAMATVTTTDTTTTANCLQDDANSPDDAGSQGSAGSQDHGNGPPDHPVPNHT
jgi:RNA polymerase sigma factor (sigma-70 family)